MCMLMKYFAYLVLAVLLILVMAGFFLVGTDGGVMLALSLVLLVPFAGLMARSALLTPAQLYSTELSISSYLGLISEFDMAVHTAGLDSQYGLDRMSWFEYGSSDEFERNVAGRTDNNDAHLFATSWNRWNAGRGYKDIDSTSMRQFLDLVDSKM